MLLVAFILGLAVSISLAQAALAALAVLLGLDAWRRRSPPRSWPLALPMLAFAGATVLAAVFSARPLESLEDAKSLFSLVAFYAVLLALPDGAAAQRTFRLLLAVVAAVAVLSRFQVALCPPEVPAFPVLRRFFRNCGRAHGFYSIYMTFAGVLSLVVLGAAPLLGARARLERWLVVAWVAAVVALVYTEVRGAWVGIVAGAAAVAAVARRGFLFVLVGITVALVLAALVSRPIRERTATLLNPRNDTLVDRVAMVKAGIRMAREHPLLGVGPNQVKRLYPQYVVPEALRRTTSHLHNTPLQILVERGLLGLAAWLALFAAFFAGAIRILRALPPTRAADRALVSGAIAAITGFLLGGLFEYNFGDTEVLLVACTVMALPFVIGRDGAGLGPESSSA